ncbi:BQ5605_C006g04052 [Microbotryum silenes-dioicae]|uniref:malate dehydrogenase n=1 Tax=Microbotryum silenes-dioicae TaxID=796604 RepID=A0A2X0P879_9BASI|nr:BQ5605_C006g04052 [Microbotryum silenes-dioicae]
MLMSDDRCSGALLTLTTSTLLHQHQLQLLYFTNMPGLKVALLGAAGGIGQPLALLLKQNPAVTELALFDVVPVVKGVAADISHVDSPAVTTGYTKDDDGLKHALKDAQVVVIPAGVPRKPGMTRDDLFNINAGIVRDLATAIAEVCPQAFVCIISNPVNSTVPIAAEVFKNANVFDPKRVFGVTTLDVVRSSTMTAQAIGEPTHGPKYKIPVIGGHSGVTILPLLSQSEPALPSSLLNDQDKLSKLITRIQQGGDEVVQAKAGAGSATLSMAYAGYKFVERLIEAAFKGKKGVIEPTYVYVKDDAKLQKEIGTPLDFFAVRVELGPNGAEKLLPLGSMSEFEKGLMKAVTGELGGSITSELRVVLVVAEGVEFISKL